MSPAEYKKSIGLNYTTSFKVKEQAKWSAVAVGRNEIYTGAMIQGKRVSTNYKIKIQKELPDNQWIKVEGTHEPIISEKVFYTVKHLLKRDTRIAPKKDKVYIFSGLLICGDCKRALIKKTVKTKNKIHRYYTCSTHKKC